MRLIDADELIKTYEKETGYKWNEKCILECPKCFIDNAPTVELRMGRMTNGVIIPVERPRGEWIAGERNGEGCDYYCSRCMQVTLEDINRINFCPKCGAKMGNIK